MQANSLQSRKITVLGAGAWGTAVALALSNRHEVLVWGRDSAAMLAMDAARENRHYLPSFALPPALRVTADFDAAIAHAAGPDALLIAACPVAGLRPLLERLKAYPIPNIVWLCKGFEGATGLLPHQVVREVLGESVPGAALSGPSFAQEVARGLPCALTVASDSAALRETVVAAVHGGNIRVYSCDDLIGVEVGGAVKNVLAIACGVVAGRGLGDNARAATVTRGFAEMRRYGRALGAAEATLGGLSGLGDLVLTCGGPASRNFAFGAALGAGVSRPTTAFVIPANAGTHLRMHQVMGPRVRGDDTVDVTVEGALAAPILAAAAAARDIDLPIATAVADLIAGRVTVDAAIERLLARPLRSEQA